MHALVAILDAPSQARTELHDSCGLDWMDMNVAFENGRPLPLRFSLTDGALESSVASIRAIADVAARHHLDLHFALEDANGATVATTRDDLEGLFRSRRTSMTRKRRVEPAPASAMDQLRRAIDRHGLTPWSESLVAIARPFLAFGTPPVVSQDDELPIGSTKLWGMPNLPRGMPWPRQKDCRATWMKDVGLDPDGLCGFIGQFCLSDLAGTRAYHLLPSHGLLSIFAFVEMDTVGTADAFILHTNALGELDRRTPPPALDDANALRSPVALHLVERLSLPEPESPHLLPLRSAGIDEDAYRRLVSELDTRGFGLLGYGFTSTAGDLTESADWHQFARLETSVEMRLDLQLEQQDFVAGRLQRAKLIYVHPE